MVVTIDITVTEKLYHTMKFHPGVLSGQLVNGHFKIWVQYPTEQFHPIPISNDIKTGMTEIPQTNHGLAKSIDANQLELVYFLQIFGRRMSTHLPIDIYLTFLHRKI